MDLLTVRQLQHQVADACAALDPDGVSLPEAVKMYEGLVRIEKLVGGARLRLSRKVEEAGAAAQAGQRSAADHLARLNGTSRRQAQDELDTSRRLRDQPATEKAVADGELSSEQATTVSDAADADPTAERRLLNKARSSGLGDLKKEADKVKANAHPDPASRRDAIRKDRHVRRFLDREGGFNWHIRGLPEDGAELETLLAPFTQAAFETARKNGEHENHDAYRFDGLLAMARASKTGGQAPKGASRNDVKTFLHIDLPTLLRGRTQPGSICHIDRLGPVDLDWVRAILGDSFVVALLTKDGETIHDVIHLGRQANALQRSYKQAQGIRCEIPGCSTTHGLELHHVSDWANTYRTEVDKLIWACGHDHDLITNHGYRITGPPGDRTWTTPDGTIITRDRPPPSAEATTARSAAPPEPGPQPQLFGTPAPA